MSKYKIGDNFHRVKGDKKYFFKTEKEALEFYSKCVVDERERLLKEFAWAQERLFEIEMKERKAT